MDFLKSELDLYKEPKNATDKLCNMIYSCILKHRNECGYPVGSNMLASSVGS